MLLFEIKVYRDILATSPADADEDERESLPSKGERTVLIRTALREVVEMGWCTAAMNQGSLRSHTNRTRV